MGPLGILTALVSAIRVGGHSWLRAVIGRARENHAAVEIELMSSTSHEVCEVWNGEGIVRSLGKPGIRQVIYLECDKDNDETLGLHTISTALDAGLLEEQGTLRRLLSLLTVLYTQYSTTNHLPSKYAVRIDSLSAC